MLLSCYHIYHQMPRPGLLHLRPDMRFGGNVDHLRGHPGIGFLPGHPPPQPCMIDNI